MQFPQQTTHPKHQKRSHDLPSQNSGPQPLHQIMDLIEQYGKDRINTITNESLKPPNSLLLAHLEMEPLLHLQDGLVRLELDVRDVGVDHEGEEVEDEVRRLAQRRVGREAVLLEGRVVRRLGAAHAVDHVFAELHHRCERFGVAAEDEAEVGVEEAA